MTPRKEPARPDAIKVGPLTYKINRDSLSHMLAERGSPTGAQYGSCDHKAQTITLDPDMAPGQTKSTLLHEVLHTAFVVSGVNLPYDDEERAVRALESPLLGLIRDNPALIAYLAGGET